MRTGGRRGGAAEAREEQPHVEVPQDIPVSPGHRLVSRGRETARLYFAHALDTVEETLNCNHVEETLNGTDRTPAIVDSVG